MKDELKGYVLENWYHNIKKEILIIYLYIEEKDEG